MAEVVNYKVTFTLEAQVWWHTSQFRICSGWSGTYTGSFFCKYFTCQYYHSTSLLCTFICCWYSRPFRGCSTKGLSLIPTPRSVILILDFVVGCCAIDLTQMLTHHSPVLRARTCILLQLLSRYSCRALQLNWTQRLQEDLESLMHDSNKMVQVVSIRIVRVWNSGLSVTLCIPVFISLMD